MNDYDDDDDATRSIFFVLENRFNPINHRYFILSIIIILIHF
jgi:hypothetical protein